MRNEDGLAGSAYLHLCEELRTLAASATACERIKTSPMPLGYVSALRAFLLLWLVTLPWTMLGPYGHAATPAVCAARRGWVAAVVGGEDGSAGQVQQIQMQ